MATSRGVSVLPDPVVVTTSSAPTAPVPPGGFPLPPGALGADDGHEIVAHVQVSSATSAYDYYLTALPADGYVVTSSEGGALPALAQIRLSGHGFGGDSQLGFSGTTVTGQLDRS